MYQIYPDQGLTQMLKVVVENGGNGLTWALFTNDEDVDEDSLFADFNLADVTWGRITLHAADFILSQVVAHVGTIQANPNVYTNTELVAVSVYGYLVYDGITQRIFAAARFDDGPRVIAPGGQTTIQAILGDYSESFVPLIDGGEF